MRYSVEITDVADAEIQEAFLWLNARNPNFAGRWLEGYKGLCQGTLDKAWIEGIGFTLSSPMAASAWPQLSSR